MAAVTQAPAHADKTRHTRWVRITHWIATLSFLILSFTGVVILMAHPRLYWGQVGNDLTPALIELPISRNHKHNGWVDSTAFFQDAASPISASRTFVIFNKNGWGRSLHFLAGWFFVLTGVIYFLAGMFSRHFRRHIVPGPKELRAQLWHDLKDHLRFRIPIAMGGPQYGLLQKCAYFLVLFFAVPLIVI